MATGAVYGPLLGGGPVWDDVFFWGADVRGGDGIGKAMAGAMGEAVPITMAVYWRPLSMATLTLQNELGMGFPWLKGANLAMFAVLACLAGVLGWAACRRAGMGWAVAMAGGVAATLFTAWHPAMAETAAWVSGRFDLMAALFFTGGLALVASGAKGRVWWLPACTALTILSKDAAMFLMLPLLAVSMADHAEGWRVRVVSAAGVLAVSAVLLAARAWVLGDGFSNPADHGEGAAGMAAIFMQAAGTYLGDMVFPAGFVSVLHPAGSMDMVTMVAGVMLVTSLGVSAAGVLKAGSGGARMLWAGGLGMAGGMVFLSAMPMFVRLTPTLVAADRYVAALVPMAGVAVALLAGRAVSALPGGGRAVLAGASLLICLNAAASWIHSRAWTDGLSFWTVAAQTRPGSTLAAAGLSMELLRRERHADAAVVADYGAGLLKTPDGGMSMDHTGVRILLAGAAAAWGRDGIPAGMAELDRIRGLAEKNPNMFKTAEAGPFLDMDVSMMKAIGYMNMGMCDEAGVELSILGGAVKRIEAMVNPSKKARDLMAGRERRLSSLVDACKMARAKGASSGG